MRERARFGDAARIRSDAVLNRMSRRQTVRAIHQQCGVSLLRAHRLCEEWNGTTPTLAQVADRLTEISGSVVSPQQVSQWELGQITPSWGHLDALCRLYRSRPDRLGFGHDYSDENQDEPAAIPLEPPAVVPPPTVPAVRDANTSPNGDPEEDPMQRRTALKAILAGTGLGLTAQALVAIESIRRGTDTALDTTTVSVGTLDHWEQQALGHAHAFQTAPSTRLLPDVVLDYAEVQALATRRQPIEYQRRLWHLTAQFAGIIGFHFNDLGDHREARAWLHTAQLAADESGDRSLRAWARAHQAFPQYYYGSLPVAVDLAREARAIAGKTPCAAAALAPAIEARALARLGRTGEAEAAIRAAEAAFTQLGPDQTDDIAFGYTEGQLHFYTGNALTRLGASQRAAEAQRRALELYPSWRRVDRALIVLDQAVCMVGDRRPDEGAHTAKEALLSFPASQRPEVVVIAARELYLSLPSTQRTLPEARDLRDVLALGSSQPHELA